MDEGREIFRIHRRGVTGTGRIHIGIVVPPAVSDRAIVLGKGTHLIGPVTAIAQRSVNKDYRHARALIHIVQCDAVPNIGCSDDWRIGVLWRGTMGRQQGKNDHYSDKAYGPGDVGHSGFPYIRHIHDTREASAAVA